MSNTEAIQEDRARLSFDFEDEDDAEDKEQINRKIEEISEQAGFTSRRAPARSNGNIAGQGAEAITPVRDRRRRAKTGRTFPFNTKIKPEVYDKICELADKATEEEGSGPVPDWSGPTTAKNTVSSLRRTGLNTMAGLTAVSQRSLTTSLASDGTAVLRPV